jgi:hypothetical protein
MLRYSLIVTFLVLSVGVFLSSIESCTKDKTLTGNTTLCDTTAVSYTNQIEPIVTLNCIGCHSSTNPKLTSYEQVVDAAKNASLFCAINHSGSCQTMPPTGKLPDSLLKLFDTWKCKNYPK